MTDEGRGRGETRKGESTGTVIITHAIGLYSLSEAKDRTNSKSFNVSLKRERGIRMELYKNR